MKTLHTFLISIILLFSACHSDSVQNETKAADQHVDSPVADPFITGGDCSYDNFDGMARVISINSLPKNYQGCLQGPEAIEIVFSAPDSMAKKRNDTFFRDTAFIEIDSRSKSGKNLMNEMKIKVGKEFRCVKRVIRMGTCTPVILTFPDDTLLSAKFCK